ncbi:TonB-dependent receptor [Prolixibacter sp. SD074]|uniref:SusC/RagA family TonB-linked outer membrane protein n=1 Tax=Prolixibacter sp. SD074 TaxID=2652391 RepID=UPI00126C2A1E|nr:TonB-dependent receptor [Prolixibacter sp. SD074]GET29465.1 SusC/RagA family TonB-linked outer membrane protein [Prolixibacter sp. SD074]
MKKKLFLTIFRLGLFVLTSLLFLDTPASASDLSGRININEGSYTLSQFINMITAQSGYDFTYQAAELPMETKASIPMQDETVGKAAERLAKTFQLKVNILNNNIILKPGDAKGKQDTKTIKGKVLDDSGQPLPGATVVIKGTTTGTVTGPDGTFSLNAPANATALSVTFIGMQGQDVTLDGRASYTVNMRPETVGLDEVVAIGYGTVKKKDLTGAVGIVKSSEIESQPTESVDKMLQGRMAGVDVVADNSPGGGVAVRVRGYSTIRNNEPLYIIDGVPVSEGINMVNPNDIASIQVLKDASSASIYGARAANGVVIITTRQGKSKDPTIRLDAYVGLQQAANKLTMLNAQQYGDMLWQAIKNDGATPANEIYGSGATPVIPQYLDAAQTEPSANTNWVDEIFRIAPVQSYNVSFSKGDNKSRQAWSLGYFNQDGIIKYTGFERVSGRLNSEYNFFDKKLKVGENISLSHTWSNVAENNSALGGVVYEAYKMPSIAPVKDLNGEYASSPLNDIQNPMGRLYRNKDNKGKTLKLFGNGYIEYKIIEGLTAKTNFGIDYTNFYERNYSPKYVETYSQQNLSSLTTSNNWKFDWVWTNTLNYVHQFGKHSINVLAGMETLKSQMEGFTGFREGFAYDDPNFRYLDAGDGGSQKNTGTGTEWSMISYISKVDYSYDNRYLLSATFRRDGSSKLGNNKWGNFPAVSAGWRVSEEKFFNVGAITNLKLRFGWGQNGNQDVPAYSTISSYYSNPNYSNYAMDGSQTSVYTGFTPTRNGNPDLKWETTTQTNFGIDLGLVRNRIEFTGDYFIKTTKDLLMEQPLPPTIGGTTQTVWTNAGEMQNKGFEITANYHSKKVNDLQWNVGLNLSHVKNELTSLPQDIEYIGLPGSYLHSVNFDQETSRSAVGEPISSFYGYKAMGLFKTQAEVDAWGKQANAQPGDIKFADLNKDGVIDANDRTFIGSPHPDLSFGLNFNLNYRSWDFSLFARGSVGAQIYDLTRYYGDFFDLSAYNKQSRTLNAWTTDNPNATVPRLSLDDPNNNIRPSSYYVQDADYVRLQNVKLGYTLPAGKLHSKRFYLYVQAQNLFTITNYNGLDPEVGLQNYSSAHKNLDIGVDRGVYPAARTYTLGVNLEF